MSSKATKARKDSYDELFNPVAENTLIDAFVPGLHFSDSVTVRGLKFFTKGATLMPQGLNPVSSNSTLEAVCEYRVCEGLFPVVLPLQALPRHLQSRTIEVTRSISQPTLPYDFAAQPMMIIK